MELYDERVQLMGKKRADRYFIKDVLLLLRPNIIRQIEGSQRLTNNVMLKNYFKVSIRNILRSKTFSLLNITGLSVGIASSMLILIYVNHELSYDKYNENYESTYRVLHRWSDDSRFQVWGNATAAPELKRFFPEVRNVFRFTGPETRLVEVDKKSFREELIYADSTAYDVFSWNMIHGKARGSLSEPNTIVLTRQLSEKYFGDRNPVGEIILIDNEHQVKVTGVVDLPQNTHFSFKAMLSMETFKNLSPEIFNWWGYADFYTYFTLHEDKDIQNLNKRIGTFLEKNNSDDPDYAIYFEPMSDAYLRSEAARPPGPTGSLSNIYIFSSVALFILAIAVINFMNLSTARSVERAKEVAIRKTIGSGRGTLVSQFLVEAILLTVMASVIAGVLVVYGHKFLEILSAKSLPVQWIFTWSNLLIGTLIVLTIGILAGSYPAFVLSGFKPVVVLKGSFKTSSKGIWLRKSLVILQFAISIVLLLGATIVFQQLRFLQSHNLGFDADQVVVLNYGYDGKVQQKLKSIKAEFAKHKDVVSVAASMATPGDFFPNAGTGIEDPKTGELSFHIPAIYEIDEDFIPTFKMTMVAGRNYSKKFPTDTINSIIVNEAAAKLFGYPDPKDIIGKSFSQWGRKGKVIGVVKDFNYVSLHKKVEPLTLRYSWGLDTSMISLRMNSTNYSKTLEELEAIWRKFAPHYPFNPHFNNANFNRQYEADKRFGLIFSTFSGLAIFVACLGLFGLTIYSTVQRTKEIGIRKVLGSSAGRIVAMLSKDFITLFLAALLIATPFAWFVMDNWLNAFAYRISIGIEVFLVSGALTLLISLATMSFKTVVAARSNPVDALRSE